MSKIRKSTIEVQGTAIAVINHTIGAYISLTDIAKYKEPNRSDHVIQNWMRNRNTIEFLGIWERLNNADFKPLEFEGFKTTRQPNNGGTAIPILKATCASMPPSNNRRGGILQRG